MSLSTIQSAMTQMHCKCGMFCNVLIPILLYKKYILYYKVFIMKIMLLIISLSLVN